MQWTLVTGGAKRLGAELCIALAESGLPILVHYNTSEVEAHRVVAACRERHVCAEAIQGDFSSQEKIESFIERCRYRFPSIKNVINNVGNYLIKSPSQTSPAEWNALFQTNLHAPFAISHALLPCICQNKGSIINIGIVGIGSITADTYCTAYRTSKMSLWMMTKSLAKELAPLSVRVNMVSPGYMENAIDLPENLTKLPMHRPASLAEVARVVVFLLDEENGYITGQNIEVGGGVRL